MRIIAIIISLMSGLFLISVLICGLWIKTQKATLAVPQDAVNFHVNLGMATVVLSLLTIGVLFFNSFRG